MTTSRILSTLTAAALLGTSLFAQGELAIRDVNRGTADRYLEIANEPGSSGYMFLIAGSARTSFFLGSFEVQVEPQLILPLGMSDGVNRQIALPAQVLGSFFVQALLIDPISMGVVGSVALDIGQADGDTERRAPDDSFDGEPGKGTDGAAGSSGAAGGAAGSAGSGGAAGSAR